MKTLEQKVTELISSVHELENNQALKQNAKLPSNSYFLNADEIVCYPRPFGDGRYPYSYDGRILWAHSSGNIKVEESTFNIFLETHEGREPNLCFFFGLDKGEKFFPVSITGAGKLPFEENIKRFTVFTPKAVYYITETENLTACVRAFMDENKNLKFSTFIKNSGENSVKTYVSAYFNLFLGHSNYEYIETKWYRKNTALKDGFLTEVTEYLSRTSCLKHYAFVKRSSVKEKVLSTTSKTNFNGGMQNQINCSTSLQNGKFEKEVLYTEFTDTAISGDIIPVTLKGGESFSVSYTVSVESDEKLAKEKANILCETKDFDSLIYADVKLGEPFSEIPNVKISGFENGINDDAFNNFIKNVYRQVEFCSRAKNYAGALIGIRDIFQQVEAGLIWIPEYCRGKIVEALNFIGVNGRAPRQYSYPPNKNIPPKMDLRAFVDQGVWIISTVYTYLKHTGDYSILKETCGYYEFSGNEVLLCDKKDTVLEHLLRIADFLTSNLDDKTNCLHALYGDWNDALDGLGKTENKDKEFGTGVSVMATLQFYQNLKELSDILEKVGDFSGKINEFTKTRARIEKGLLENAIVEKDGIRKILHGWGDEMSFKVASFCDADGKSRDGLTTNAYFVISDMLSADETLKKDILGAYERLNSKYGIKTFEPYFAEDDRKVGRITHLPKGTAENGSVYIHATLFAIWSLFKMNEPKFAWEQLYKILPITHEEISTTPFVMPNSFIYNEEKNFDGESMSDWFTGSGCVLIKVLTWYIFGVQPTLNGLEIKMPSYVPFKKGEITLKIKSATVTVKYSKLGTGRKYILNGKQVDSVSLLDENLKNGKFVVEITD